MDKIFFYLSKAVIIIPLVIVIIALVIRLTQSGTIKSSVQQIPASPIIVPSELKTASPSSGRIINLTGPYRCHYENKNLDADVYIKNKQFAGEIKNKSIVNKLLLTGDCLYWWQKNSYSGEKMCGLSPIISLWETLSKLNIVNVGSIMQYLPKDKIKDLVGTNEADLKNILSNCQDSQVENKVFDLPKVVLFKTVNFLSPSPNR